MCRISKGYLKAKFVHERWVASEKK